MKERIVGEKQMREAEAKAQENGLNEDVLIENAANALFWRIRQNRIGYGGRARQDARSAAHPAEGGEYLPPAQSGLCDAYEKECEIRAAVFVGGGNNAADGLSLARLLLLHGACVDVLQTTDALNAHAEARLKAFRRLGGTVLQADKADEQDMRRYTLIVDAMFGIGLTRAVEGVFAHAVRLMNAARSNAVVVCADIPSGLHADTGEVLGCAVRADYTVTFGAYKTGHFLGAAADYCGQLSLCDLGIAVETGAFLCSQACPAAPRRPKVGHKGDYGRIRVIGGCPTMIGAPLLSAESAVRCGAGLTTLCVADSLCAAYQQRVREITLTFLPQREGFVRFDTAALDAVAENADCIAIGMGMGRNPDLRDIVGYLSRAFYGTLVVDADALNALAGHLDVLQNHVCRLVLTPHRGEFQRLFGECGSSVVQSTESAARQVGGVIVHKSNVTVISDGTHTYLNAAGTPAMAKGGSGDALAGAVAAYAARMPALEAAARAAYVCGVAAEKAAGRCGEDALTASDTIGELV